MVPNASGSTPRYLVQTTPGLRTAAVAARLRPRRMRPAHDSGPLCDRRAAVADTQKRFGSDVGLVADYLHLLCGPVHAGPVQSCTRTMKESATIRAAAGHNKADH